jgi:hypothetical protein
MAYEVLAVVEMTPTGEIRTAHSRTCPSAAVFITNLTWSGLGGEMPVVIIVDTFAPSYSRVFFLVLQVETSSLAPSVTSPVS